METGVGEDGLVSLNETINTIVDTGFGQTICQAAPMALTAPAESLGISQPIEDEKQNFIQAHKNALLAAAAVCVVLYLLR